MEAFAERGATDTVRCRATLPSGDSCTGGLWRSLSADLIEVSHRLPKGRRLTLVLPLSAAQQTLIPCIACGTRWWPATSLWPRQLSQEQAALALIAQRPRSELTGLLNIESPLHHAEAV